MTQESLKVGNCAVCIFL
ncbi:unnamed protein product [Linum tenue]|uniref:Uncharacterized protein n=1 Tax=Linum tenue TaxID=586396 RepID=A0AAV0IIR7_9ROSI|nr:unnamed protein product [Linum tenue]